jgi:hypothetical protein
MGMLCVSTKLRPPNLPYSLQVVAGFLDCEYGEKLFEDEWKARAPFREVSGADPAL